MFGSPSSSTSAPSPSILPGSSSSCPHQNPNDTKRKRRPAGTPDPDAEVVSLSPQTLLESERYVCDICNQGFQRDQNLQMHRRRHKVPWKLLKRKDPAAEEAAPPRKRVFVCPEPTCLHHDPSHALGDLVGIRKHYRRKHSDSRQWGCARCGKAYAVHSDYKAHLKTCGTRGHSCDCGRVFSRVESFIEHQDACIASHAHGETRTPQPGSPTRTTSHPVQTLPPRNNQPQTCNLELQLLPSPHPHHSIFTPPSEDARTTQLTGEQIRIAAEEKAAADDERRRARSDVEIAEQELVNAKRIRDQARAELEKAYTFKDEVAKRINSILVHITCHDCRHKLLS